MNRQTRKTVRASLSTDYGPRGLTKAKAGVDLWLKEIAPSTELRKWFEHAYREMETVPGTLSNRTQHNTDLIELLKRKAQDGLITLVMQPEMRKHNEALVLKQFLERGNS